MAETPASDELMPHHAHVDETTRPDTPELEGGALQPEELTGRASASGEDLTALFQNNSAVHIVDGFLGGSDDDEDVRIPKESDRPLEGDQ